MTQPPTETDVQVLPLTASSKIRVSNLRVWLAAAYLVGVTSILFALLSGWGYDDPYITYRYAHNLASGAGFVYNPGEQVLSTTTPFFAILLAGLSFVWPDLPHLANLIGALSLAAGGLLIWRLGEIWETPMVSWAGLLLYPFFPLLHSTFGSETPLYLAFCLGSIAAYAQQRYGWTAALSALAVLTRPDGILIPALLALDFLIFHRKPIPWRAALIFLLLTLPWVAFSSAYFGSPLPATLATKQHQGAMAISQRFFGGFISLAGGLLDRWHYRLEALLGLIGLIFNFARARRWLLLLSWTAIYFTAYSALGVSRYFWYYAPLVPGFIVLVGLGLQALHDLFSAPRKPAQPAIHAAILLFSGATLILLLAGQALDVRTLLATQDRRLPVYRAIGEWVSQNTPPAARVGALEVGVIGYYAERSMVDFAGLIQPDVARQLQSETTYEDAAIWAIQRYEPQYVILHQGGFPKVMTQLEARGCQAIQHFAGASFGYSQDLNLYVCP